jgi:hypothetical protein
MTPTLGSVVQQRVRLAVHLSGDSGAGNGVQNAEPSSAPATINPMSNAITREPPLT